jgi:hypothetical protein
MDVSCLPFCSSLCFFGFDLFPQFFIAGFAKQGKHIFLVALHARLVKWVDTGNIAADATGKLKEVEQRSQGMGILPRHMDQKVRHPALYMGKDRGLHGIFIDKVHGLPGKVV